MVLRAVMVFVVVAGTAKGSQLVSMAIAADAKHARLDSLQDVDESERPVQNNDTRPALHDANLTADCFYGIEEAQKQVYTLLTTASVDFAAFDWVALVLPMERAFEHLKQNRIPLAEFMIQEYHTLFITDRLGALFLCNAPASKKSATIGVASLSTRLHTLKGQCPEQVITNTTFERLNDWVDLQSLVYECVLSGAAPLNTTEERQHALKSIGSSTLNDIASLQELHVKQAYDQLVTQTIQFLCEREHRIDYLGAISPEAQTLAYRHCTDIAGGKHVELEVEQFKRVVQTKARFGQHPSLAARHPFRSHDSATWYQPGYHNWSDWARRRRAVKHNGRDDWKRSKCANESNPDFDGMFSNYVHDGCSSSVALGWKNSITPACFSHDMCYDCAYEFEGNGWQCDFRFIRDLKNECSRKTPWYEVFLCKAQADVMFVAAAIWGRINKEKPAWCRSACAQSVWQTQTEDTFRALDPWYG